MSYIIDLIEGIFDSFFLFIDSILAFFRMLWNVLIVVFDFIIQIPSFLRLMTSFVADVPAILSWLPGVVVASISLTFVVAIIWKICGRT